MKGQFLIIQFIVFFMIGLSIFLAMGNFFRMQSDIFRADVTELSTKLVNSYLSAASIASIDSCKQCDVVETAIELQNTTAGYFVEAALSDEGLNVSLAPPGSECYLSSVHNFNESVTMEGKASSALPIVLTYDRNQNKLSIE